MSREFPAQLAGLSMGSRLAGYRIEAPLGAGGMAVVYRAYDERLNRPVALKVFAPITGDRAARQRFIDESRSAAAVDHEHIIPVYDAGDARGFLFIAMRMVRGGDLRELLEREGTLPPARAAGIVSQVAAALDAAHGAGLVHRDVKPANILLAAPAGERDYVYLSDFGMSKQAMRSTRLTGTGQFVGTPDYAAPEQGRDVPLDGRADQYALACVAYHMLTGAPPFEREDPWAVLMAHLSEPPPSVQVRRPELPDAADRVLERALAKVPEKRYATCREFAGALRGALALAPGPAAAGPSALTSPGRASAGLPASPSYQVTQSSPAPSKGSSLLQPASAGGGPLPAERSAGRSGDRLRVAAWGLAGLLLAAAAGLTAFMLAAHHSPKSAPAGYQGHASVPVAAGAPADPARQPPGVSREIDRIVAAGSTIVTTGTQKSGGVIRQQFYVSADGGAMWHLAPMQRYGGGLPAGYTANRIAGGPRGWMAEGPQALWTSKNGLSWTLAATHGISPQLSGDSISVVTATAGGFLAAGGTGKAGGNQAVIWTSHDGTRWQRLTATRLGLKVAGTAPAFMQYATSRGSDTLISDGSSVWLSTDGDTAWTRVTIPVDHGASGSITGLGFDGSGLVAVRPGTGASGAPGGVAYFSSNGQVWQFAGLIDPAGGWTPTLVKGSKYGFVVVGHTVGQNVGYASTGTGATWWPTRPLGSTAGTTINSATVGSGGTVIAVGAAGQHVVFIMTRPGS